MAWQQLVMDVFLRISRDREQVLDGLDADELHEQPFPNGNTIAWLTWHLTRSHDRNISKLAGEDQLWITEGWYATAGWVGRQHLESLTLTGRAPGKRSRYWERRTIKAGTLSANPLMVRTVRRRRLPRRCPTLDTSA